MENQDSRPSPLEQAANYEPNIPEHYIEGEPYAYTDGHQEGFKAGATWQKEQYKEVIALINEAAQALDTIGHNRELFTKIKTTLKQLQD
jgi:hypothetical protein